MNSLSEEDDVPISKEEIELLTVPQLKQQLRLRGLKVSGKKQDLLNRLLDSFNMKWEQPSMGDDRKGLDNDSEVSHPEVVANNGSKAPSKSPEKIDGKNNKKTKAQQFAEEHGKEFIDVTAYVDEEDEGKDVKSSIPTSAEEEDNPQSENPEVWGSEAKIVDDYGQPDDNLNQKPLIEDNYEDEEYTLCDLVNF